MYTHYRKVHHGVSTNGATANLMFFDRGICFLIFCV